MENIFMSKSAADYNHLKDRRDRGSNYLEIHLRDSEPKDLNEVNTITSNIHLLGLTVFAVHAPMKRDFIVDSLGSKRAKERLRLVSQLAANMYKSHNKQMIVVLHQELSLEQIIDLDLIHGIKDTLQELLLEFPMVDYVFENLTLLNYENGQIITRNSHFDEPVKLANYFRTALKTHRIGTILDTCHMLSTIRMNDELVKYGPFNKLDIKDFFWAYKDTLKLIHLTNATDFGFGDNHGTVFSSQADINVLKEILSCIEEIEFKQPITLEIVEKNHAFAPLYSEMRDVLISLGINNF